LSRLPYHQALRPCRATQTDQDRRPRHAPRLRHHLPAGRSCGNRPHSARHPRRHPPPSSATVMRVTALRTQTERRRQDRSARRAEKRRRRARLLPVRGLIRPTSGVCTTAHAGRGEKRLLNSRNWVTLSSNVMPLGECRATWLSSQ
jgi:hypothetical protein